MPGKTPFLLSKRALKQLSSVIDTRRDVCWLGRLKKEFQMRTNPNVDKLKRVSVRGSDNSIVPDNDADASEVMGKILDVRVAHVRACATYCAGRQCG